MSKEALSIVDTLKLALEALELHGNQYPHMVKGYCLDAITAIKEALAQPEQRSVSEHLEPVATLDDLEQEIYENTRQFVSRDVMEWMLKRYYTTPPQRTWAGLTPEEIDEIEKETWDEDHKSWGIHDFAEAIEAKLKEKNT